MDLVRNSDLTVGQTLTAAVLAVALYLVLRVLSKKPYEAYPLIGHLWEFGVQPRWAQADWVLAATKHFKGRTWGISIPGVVPRGHVITNPACLKYVINTQVNAFIKSAYFADRTKDLIGNGILNAVGEHWKMQRNAGKVFASSSLLDYLTTPSLPAHLPRMLAQLDAAADKDEVIDLGEVMVEYIFAVFGDVAFDATWEELEPLSSRFDNALAGISLRFAIRAFQLVEKVSPYGRRLRQDIAFLREAGGRLVKKKLAALRAEEEGGAVGDENKGVFIRALYQEGLDEGSIVDSCLNSVIAGRDTTAQALTWGFYELITNPACQAKLADAVDNLPPNCSLSEMIAQRPFLEWVISETIRMHPSAPFGVAQNTSGITHVLPDNTVVMPLDQVFWSPWSIQRYHPVFGSQPEAFIPERWETMDRKPTVYEAPAFHAGPRSCLGQQMARTEMAYVLVELVKRYEMVRAWGDGDRKLDEGMAGEMLGGLPVKVKRRV